MFSFLPFVGCGGGHVWSDYSPTDRWRVTPFHNKDEQAVERLYERNCERGNCEATETQWRGVGVTEAEGANETLERLPKLHAPQYQCPFCKTVHGYAAIDVVSVSIWNGRRFEWVCPTCERQTVGSNWSKAE